MSHIHKSSEEFDKPPLTVSSQVNLLKSRGLIVKDIEIAEQFLLHCNYYRFSGYALHFEIFENRERTHKFRSNTTFENVKDLYEFDDRLRAILFDYIGHIEISVRSTLCNVMALRTMDSHWYLDRNLFCSEFKQKNKRGKVEYSLFLNAVKDESYRSREIFIKSYKKKYCKPKHPPSWMIIEILTMGNWSKLYNNLDSQVYKEEISNLYDVNVKYFESWIRALSGLRNHCAHHSRIWNKKFHISPSLTNQTKKQLKELFAENSEYTWFFINYCG